MNLDDKNVFEIYMTTDQVDSLLGLHDFPRGLADKFGSARRLVSGDDTDDDAKAFVVIQIMK
jgi:hypothetical protein